MIMRAATIRAAPPTAALDQPGPLWRRWVMITTAGEVVGFSAPAVAGALTAVSQVSDLIQAAVLVAAGAIEGGLLGWAQATVLRRVITELNAWAWVRATALGAVVAYAVGMLPSVIVPAPMPVMLALVVVGGPILLGSIGVAQWLVLRRCRPHSAWWIAMTASAWLLGLGAFLAIATPLWRTGQSAGLIIAIGVLAALGMAATVAAVTGWGVLRLRGTGSTHGSPRVGEGYS